MKNEAYAKHMSSRNNDHVNWQQADSQSTHSDGGESVTSQDIRSLEQQLEKIDREVR